MCLFSQFGHIQARNKRTDTREYIHFDPRHGEGHIPSAIVCAVSASQLLAHPLKNRIGIAPHPIHQIDAGRNGANGADAEAVHGCQAISIERVVLDSERHAQCSLVGRSQGLFQQTHRVLLEGRTMIIYSCI